jgi:hypothetical protein
MIHFFLNLNTCPFLLIFKNHQLNSLFVIKFKIIIFMCSLNNKCHVDVFSFIQCDNCLPTQRERGSPPESLLFLGRRRVYWPLSLEFSFGQCLRSFPHHSFWLTVFCNIKQGPHRQLLFFKGWYHKMASLFPFKEYNILKCNHNSFFLQGHTLPESAVDEILYQFTKLLMKSPKAYVFHLVKWVIPLRLSDFT